MRSYSVIVPAAGVGHRMGLTIPKQYLKLHGKTVIEHTLITLLSYPAIGQVVLVLQAEDAYWDQLKFQHPRLQLCRAGGLTRGHSVYHGLSALNPVAKAQDWVLVHDAVRPCLQHADLDRLIAHLSKHAVGGLLGVPVHSTLKRVGAQQTVMATLSRQEIWQAMTPQMFRYGLLHQALTTALASQQIVTDEAPAIEYLGYAPQMVLGRADNLKLTTPEDLAQIAAILSGQART